MNLQQLLAILLSFLFLFFLKLKKKPYKSCVGVLELCVHWNWIFFVYYFEIMYVPIKLETWDKKIITSRILGMLLLNKHKKFQKEN